MADNNKNTEYVRKVMQQATEGKLSGKYKAPVNGRLPEQCRPVDLTKNQNPPKEDKTK